MKRILLTLMIVLMLTPVVSARAAAPAAEELTRLLKEFLDGASRNDVKVHERFWADDLIYTRSAGVRMGKAEILENARSGPTATAEDADHLHRRGHPYPAVRRHRRRRLPPRRHDRQRRQGRSSREYLNTGTFVKRNGEWRAAAWQATRMPEAEPQRLEPARSAR